MTKKRGGAWCGCVTESSLTALCSKINNREREMNVRKELLLNRMSTIWEDGGFIVSKKTIYKDSAPPWKFLKGKREVILIIEMMGVRVVTIPHYTGPCAGLSTSCDFFLDAILFTQFIHKITEGEEIWSLVNSFLLHWSTERANRLRKILCDQKIWKVCQGQRKIEHGGAWLRLVTKGCTLRVPLPAESCLQITTC